MRDAGASRWMVQISRLTVPALRVAAIALGVGLLITAGAARAEDDEDDDKTFEEKIIEGLMAGIGGTNMENRGIEYRERSPLVVPPRLELPPPASASEDVKVANWPKDPDVARRKGAIAARKKEKKEYTPRPLTPAELEVGRTAKPVRTNNDPMQPGDKSNSP